MMSPHVKLALATIDTYIKYQWVIGIPENIPEEFLNIRAGVFVCLKTHGELRGCIGTIEPVQDNLATEIIANAISASMHDPRFMAVELSELGHLECSVDVLSEPEPVDDLRQLDPKKYGVIVQNGARKGLLLPDLDGVDTVEEQIDIARRKASISMSKEIELFRFEVKRFN